MVVRGEMWWKREFSYGSFLSKETDLDFNCIALGRVCFELGRLDYQCLYDHFRYECLNASTSLIEIRALISVSVYSIVNNR